MYTTVVFDLDGTLLNTLDDLACSTNYALVNNGYPTRTTEEIRRFVGNGIRKLAIRAMPEEKADDQDAVNAVFADLTAHYKRHCSDQTGPYPGVLDLLRALKERGIKMGVASNKIHSAVTELNEIYFEGLIGAAVGVEEGRPAKPDPDMVGRILKELGSTQEETLYVGDSQVDILTAKNAGLYFVAVLWGFRDREELLAAGALRFIQKPTELLQYF